MSSNPAIELASAIQSVSVQRNPDPNRDINPSTAASQKVPGQVISASSGSEHRPCPSSSSSHSNTSTTLSSIPSDIIRPIPRPQYPQKQYPPIPDFRFEQSYLASIKSAQNNWQVAYITLRDQVVLPLTQGIMWNLVISGWRHWNRGTKFRGASFGARVRRWWWDVNHWTVPAPGAGQKKNAEDTADFFVQQSGTSLGD